MVTKAPFLTYMVLPLGAVLPWILLFAWVQSVAAKNNDWNSLGVVATGMFALGGCILALIISVLVSLLVRSDMTWIARFGWGAGTSLVVIFLGWFFALQKEKSSMKASASREQQQAALMAQKNPNAPKGSTESFFAEIIMVRPVEGQWMYRAPHTKPDGEKASSMGVYNVRIEGFWPDQMKPHGLLGRVSDEADVDSDGMWVTAIRQSPKDINLTKTQRYQVWIENQKPDGYESDGIPKHKDGPTTKFWGLADVIAESAYNGYDPKDVEP